MAAPQGTLTFTGGILPTQVLRWSVTQQHGLTPNIFSLRMIMPLDGSTPDKFGDVVLSYGNTIITIPDCCCDKVERPDDDTLEWDVTIFDRRWRWALARIDGLYNQRWKNGTELRDETKKKPSELATLCLKAMGEQGYDLTALQQFDGNDWPETNWDNAFAANALQEICERYGCRAIYRQRTDNVVIVQVGVGDPLNLAIPYLSNSLVFDPPELPGTIIVRLGPTSFQYDWSLFPVAVDVDAQILPIKKVTYAPGPPKPANPTDPPFDLTTGTYLDQISGYWPWLGLDRYGQPAPYLRQLAADNIYKLWRIHPPKQILGLNKAWGDSAKTKPNLETFPDASQAAIATWLWRIALQNEQNDRMSALANPQAVQFDEYNKEVSSAAQPAWVYGQYSDPNQSGSPNVLIDDLDDKKNTINGSGLKKLNPKLVVSAADLNASSKPGDPLDPKTLSWKVVGSGFYDGSFTIVPEWGLVKFADRVYQQCRIKSSGVTVKMADGSSPPASYNNFPATLFLRTRCFLRDPETRGWVRAERVRVLDKSNPTIRYETRDDIFLKMTARYTSYYLGPDTVTVPPSFTPNKIEDNWDQVKEAADVYLDEIEAEYQNRQPQSVVYIGLVPQDLDGAIREVTWYTDDEGFAYTRVSRDQEYLVWHQDYGERRLAERVKAKTAEKANPVPPGAVAGAGIF